MEGSEPTERPGRRPSTAGSLTDYVAWRHGLRRPWGPAGPALFRQVGRALELPGLPRRRRLRGSVWGVSVMKNEADVVAPVVEHLFRQGVDAVLVADNLSTDETPLLLSELAKSYPVHLALDREPGHYHGVKVTILSDWARRAGADWIVPFDADEFWFAPGATLAEFLRNSPYKRLWAEMHNLYPAPGVPFRQGAWRLESQPHNLKKVAFRAHRYAVVTQGNHYVQRPGAWSKDLGVVHVPWRSWDQFRRKTVEGAEAYSQTTLHGSLGAHKRRLGGLDEQAAKEVWDRIVRGEPVEGACWSPGRPAVLVDPLGWETWDPDKVLGADTAHQL